MTPRGSRDTTWSRTTGGDVSANRMHGHLSALWNWAIQPKRAYAEKTPFNHAGRVPEELKKPQERGRDRRLRDARSSAEGTPEWKPENCVFGNEIGGPT